jgi:hypothetical protein
VYDGKTERSSGTRMMTFASCLPWPPPGPAQVKCEAGTGDEPGGVLPGEADQAGGLGDRQLDRADAGRAGLPGQGGDGRIPEGYAQVSVADLLLVIVFVLVIAGLAVVVVVGGGGGRGRDVAAQAVADGDVAELGERGEGGVPADSVPGAGL